MYLPQGTELHHRYVIESLLGHGGFGITYAAHDKTLNVRVAVKEYLPRQLATRGEGQTKVSVYTGEARQHYDYGLSKFMEEAQSVARFSHHPNIVSARDYFTANGTAYMVMEYVEGVTLKEYLEKKGGRISFEEAKGVMMPVMDALREVHQAGMLHRDVSPDNIYITTSAQVKILDFGAARYFSGEQSKSLSVILKPGYAPEEQYRSSGKQGSWTDVYAVGATIYKALTGKTPPDALDRKEEDTLEPPSRLGVIIPPFAEQALLQALAINAGQRFQNMGEFQQALTGGEPMTIGFQPGSFSFQPTRAPSYTPVSGPVSAPPPVSAQSGSHPSHQPSHYPQAPRRGANPAAIAAGIGAGIIGLVLVVGLVWWMGRDRGKDDPITDPQSTKQVVVKPEEFLAEGIKQYKNKKFKEALAALEKARDHKLKQPELFLYLGATYVKLDNPKEAIKAWEEAVKLKPDYWEAYSNLAVTYWSQGQKDLALKQYKILQSKDSTLARTLQEKIPGLASYAPQADQPPGPFVEPPKVPQPSDVAKEELDKGRKYYQDKDFVKAREALMEAVKLNPQEAEAHYLLGLTYASLNKPQPKEALEELRQAVLLKPEEYTWSTIGKKLDELKRPQIAAGAFKEAVKANGNDAEAHYQLGGTYVKLKETKLAKEQQEALKDQNPEVMLLSLALVISGIGCATTNPDGAPSTAGSTVGGAVGGALLGAALGALIGVATGDPAGGALRGAIAGAAAGAVAGFVYAKHQEQVVRDRQAAEAMYSYQPEQGEKVIIEALEVAPNTVTMGDEVALNTNFTVLTGNDQPVDMVITQTITSQGKPVDKPFVDKASRKSGTYGVSYSTKIPDNVPEGRYALVTRVQTANTMDEKTSEFLVAKKAASNQREIHLVSLNGVPVNN